MPLHLTWSFIVVRRNVIVGYLIIPIIIAHFWYPPNDFPLWRICPDQVAGAGTRAARNGGATMGSGAAKVLNNDGLSDAISPVGRFGRSRADAFPVVFEALFDKIF